MTKIGGMDQNEGIEVGGKDSGKVDAIIVFSIGRDGIL
jgi:hypothetical protein